MFLMRKLYNSRLVFDVLLKKICTSALPMKYYRDVNIIAGINISGPAKALLVKEYHVQTTLFTVFTNVGTVGFDTYS